MADQKLFTESEMKKMFLFGLWADDCAVRRYRYPDDSVADIDEKEADDEFNRKLQELITNR